MPSRKRLLSYWVVFAVTICLGACSNKQKAAKQDKQDKQPSSMKPTPVAKLTNDAATAKPKVRLPPKPRATPPPNAPPRTIKIQILSATIKNKVVEGAEVFFQKNRHSSVAAKTGKTGKAVAVHKFGVDNKTVSLIVKKKGFTPLVVACPCDGMAYAISRPIKDLESFRVVLNWGKRPLDLDLHAVYPRNHIYFESKKGQDAFLDVDDTTSYGPETITIKKRHVGDKYVFAIHDFSHAGRHGLRALANSQAKVMVYVGKSLIRAYYVPRKMGELWVLFGVDGNGAFHDIDNVVDVSVATKIGKYLKQLIRRKDWGFPTRTSRAAANRAKTLAAQGNALLNAGQTNRAITYFRDAIASDRNCLPAYRGLTKTYLKTGQSAEATWATRKATSLAALPTKTRGYRVPNEKITLTVSSKLGNWKHYTFGGKNVIDDNLWTSWQPKRKRGGGVGEWVLMTFSAPQTVTGFEFSNGFRRLDELGDLYRMNNRIKDAVLELSDGTKFPIHFEDADKEQSFILPAPVTCTSVKLVVKSIYKGSKWNDLAVSEFHALSKE